VTPPLLIVLFLTRHQAGGGYPRRDRCDRDVPPRVAVVRNDLIHSIELPAEREGAARLLGALALPGWVHRDEVALGLTGAKRRAEDVHRLMGLSSASESRARKKDLGPALEAAGLMPSDYLDIDLEGNRKAFRELRNARDDVSLLLDAEDLNEVRWILDTARLGGNGEPDVAMASLWDSAAKEHVLDRFRELETFAARPTRIPRSGWRLAAPEPAVVQREGVEAAGKGVEAALVDPGPKPPRRFLRHLLVATVGLLSLVLAVAGVSNWIDDPVSRPPGVVLRVDNRITSGMQVREDPQPVPLSTRPVPGCGSRGCEVDRSPTWESKQPIDRAVCQQPGEPITNGNNESPTDDKNPLLDTSSLYYGVVLEDGTHGYIAEVWIAREQRGGLGLPPCSRVLPDLARR